MENKCPDYNSLDAEPKKKKGYYCQSVTSVLENMFAMAGVIPKNVRNKMPADDTKSTGFSTVQVKNSTIATFRYLSERTGIEIKRLVDDALIAWGKAALVGANAALDGLSKESKKP